MTLGKAHTELQAIYDILLDPLTRPIEAADRYPLNVRLEELSSWIDSYYARMEAL